MAADLSSHPAIVRAVRDCVAGRGVQPRESLQWIGDAVSASCSGHTMRVGEPYRRRGDYCEEGAWVVPFGFYRSRCCVWAWCCFPLNLDERGRRTWSFVLVGSVGDVVING